MFLRWMGPERLRRVARDRTMADTACKPSASGCRYNLVTPVIH